MSQYPIQYVSPTQIKDFVYRDPADVLHPVWTGNIGSISKPSVPGYRPPKVSIIFKGDIAGKAWNMYDISESLKATAYATAHPTTPVTAPTPPTQTQYVSQATAVTAGFKVGDTYYGTDLAYHVVNPQ